MCVYSSSRLVVVYVPSISSIVLIVKFMEEYIFPFRDDDVFLPCDQQRLEFYIISLRENSVNQYYKAHNKPVRPGSSEVTLVTFLHVGT